MNTVKKQELDEILFVNLN